MGSAYGQTSASPRSVSAPKPSGKKAGAAKLVSVSIDIVENGFIGRCRYEGKPDRSGFPGYMPEKDYALADRKAVDGFLDEVLGLTKAAKK